jgi:SAM-dependent methyltransferase
VANPIRFDDGAAYERYMGAWSRLAGEAFLQWLAPAPGLQWLDVGCGNGAFTQLIVERCAPASVTGIDPSEGALAFARARFAPGAARFLQGDAMDLRLPDRSVDAAVMPLVIFFVPDPAKGVAEMARVVRASGVVSAYGWDLLGGGFPYEALQAELRAMDVEVPMPPSPGASAVEALRELWAGAGLQDVQTLRIQVQRRFAGFDDYWDTILGGPSVRAALAGMRPEALPRLQERMRAKLRPDGSGGIACRAQANAVRGRVSP